MKQQEIIAIMALEGKYVVPYRDGVACEGHLNLANTNIKQLPDNLVIGGNLNVDRSVIETLPNNLVVLGSLFAYSSGYLLGLPRNLTVCGMIMYRPEPLKKFTKRLFVGESLHIQRTCLNKHNNIRSDAVIGGSVYYEDCSIASPPDVKEFAKMNVANLIHINRDIISHDLAADYDFKHLGEFKYVIT